MKKLKYILYLLSFVVLFSSCSNDDGPTPPKYNGNKVGLFAENIRPITAPENMKNSDDPKAGEAVDILEDANEFRDLDGFFEVPEGATKRNGPVTPANARIASATYTVYEWTYGYGTKVIWQHADQGDHETFEIFIGSEEDEFIKMYEVIQNKDGKKGSLNYFGFMEWKWEIKDNESYHIDLNYFAGLYSYKIVSNKDLSGSIKVYSNDLLTQEYEWTKDGRGWWKQYSEGEEVDSKTW